MKLKVNEHVLIPRPETEELVEWVVKETRNKKEGDLKTLNSQLTILDIGAGSGCISIALKKELPYADIFAIDVSDDALKVAHQNAVDQNTAIQFLQLDFLNETLWKSLKTFDTIISNPPYIPTNKKNKIPKNVVEHEPHLALFVAKDDPFIFYKKIACFAESHLKQKGKIFVEINEDYSKHVQKLFAEKNFKTEIRKDFFGKERMICGYK